MKPNEVSGDMCVLAVVHLPHLLPQQIVNYTNVAGWFLADEDDNNIGLPLRQDASNTVALHKRTPGVPTYQVCRLAAKAG